MLPDKNLFFSSGCLYGYDNVKQLRTPSLRRSRSLCLSRISNIHSGGNQGRAGRPDLGHEDTGENQILEIIFTHLMQIFKVCKL
jgi:hypothetical protein